jgi:light-regulated signal transduction histidine kinase (bacteriophytochrome)
MKRFHDSNQIPGTGIDLKACKRIMENHGGSISAKSKPGEEVVYQLKIPRIQQEGN